MDDDMYVCSVMESSAKKRYVRGERKRREKNPSSIEGGGGTGDRGGQIWELQKAVVVWDSG